MRKSRNFAFEAVKDEIWLDVVGYEGHYLVSDAGRVVSIKRPKRQLLGFGDRMGYPSVNLFADSNGKTVCVHRLVAEAFIPNPGMFPTVNHVDGDKTNNHVCNLEWASYSDNNQHAHDTGLKKQAVSVIAEPMSGGVCYWFFSQAQAARHFGLKSSSHISEAVLGKFKHHKGYVWSKCIADIESGNLKYWPERHAE